MRQAVGLANAIRKRHARDFFENMTMHLRLAGAKSIPTFQEVYPDEPEESLDVTSDAATVSMMDKLAAEKLKELEAQWQATNS